VHFKQLIDKSYLIKIIFIHQISPYYIHHITEEFLSQNGSVNGTCIFPQENRKEN